MNWFSGRLVPGVDPADEESADEQMNFGFVTGDASIPAPYFYATAYPQPEGLEQAELPAPARWNTEGFQGAVLDYASIAGQPDADRRLLRFLRGIHAAGREQMARRTL